jgi:hypothetical protein
MPSTAGLYDEVRTTWDRPQGPTTECRSCGAPIVWSTSDSTGRKAPIDVAPVSDGPIVIVGKRGDRYHVLRKSDAHRDQVAPGTVRFSNHFQVCPQSKQWRDGQENR